MKQVEISESDNPSKERIWDKMYQCRDLELSSFWQKSLFLFGFMSLCFAGYSGLFMHCINTDKDLPLFSPIHLIMSAIALLGIIMSVLWVFMTKGSKAWYEVYEKSIYAIESEIFKRNNKKYVMGEWAKRMNSDYDLAFWTNKPGSFSPSKINMVIGKIMIIVWTLCESYSIINFVKLDFQDDWLICLVIANVATSEAI